MKETSCDTWRGRKNGAVLLACLFALSTGHAMASTSGEGGRSSLLFGLDGTPAYRAHIGSAVKSWLAASEVARRTMLIHKCTALDREFPGRPAPRMVRVIDDANRWLLGEDVGSVPSNPLAAEGRAITSQVVGRAYTAQQLANWNAFRESEQGRRALAVSDVRLALLESSRWLVDVNTGRSSSWPLARVRALSDELALRPAVDAAFNDVTPGGARVLAAISMVPGETDAEDNFISAASDSGALARAFLKRISNEDAKAFAALQSNEVYRRWPRLSQQLLQYQAGKPSPSGLPGMVAKVSIEEFCADASIQDCAATESFAQDLEAYRTRLTEAFQGGFVDRSIQQLVRQSPEAGCP